MDRHTYAPGPRWYIEEGGETSPPPLMMRHVQGWLAPIFAHLLYTRRAQTCRPLRLGVAAYQRAKARLPVDDALPFGWPCP